MTAPGEPATHTVGYVLLREELLSVSDAQTHDDGRVSAEVLFAFEGERRRARDIFVETEGWLLLDEMIELPLEPAPVGTPTTSLDEATLQGLSILGFAPEYVPSEPWMVAGGTAISMRPGDTRVLVLGVLDFDGCGPIGFLCFIPVAVSAGWSVAPINGASIDPNSGLLTIDAMVPSGSVFTARADVEGGRRHVAADVYVYTPEGNPLVGLWREEAQVACGTRAESDPTLAIEELNFDADGTFAVTWVPFESYVDYWGTYTFDLERGTLELTVTGGNHIPPDVDGEGRFTVDATRRLNLTDIWLGASPQRDPGTPSASSGPANCGHRFAG
ncbi:MAG: hypothetical protein H0V49_11015 [Nocardioidaceae bacterium]|nr:hypothetical protein [Nocardioidaceae bacterium]